MSHFDPEKNHLFDAKTTCFLIDLEPEEDCESSYYEFMQEYISIIPKDHLEPIIHAGFAFKAFEFANSTVFLAIVARLQA